MQTHFRLLAVALTVTSISLLNASAWADSVNEATGALARLDAFVGTGANGQGWSKYLNLPALREQIAKGAAANPAQVAEVVAKLDSGAPGLELPQFRQLRSALADWSTDLVIAQAGGLSQAALAAQANFRPVTPEEKAATRKTLDTALAALDRYLTTAGPHGAGWRNFLKFSDLTKQLASPTPDVETLKTIAGQFSTDNVGLELPVFANSGAALNRYVNALEAEMPDTATQYAAQLKGLADALKSYPDNYSDESSNTIGAQLGWLERMRQALALVEAARKKHSVPNLHAKVSSRLVAAGISQPVDDVAPVQDNILGTSISGTGHTVGNIDVVLIPNPDKAVLETRLVGTTATRTVGYNGPATISANGSTAISGSKRITIDAHGLVGEPAQAAANTRTQITGVSAGGRIANRVANDRVYEKKAEAERVGSQHAAARVRSRVDAQANTQLGKAHADFVQKFRNPLVRRGEFPEVLRFSTTADSLLVDLLQANRNQLGAPTAPPSVTVENDLAVQLHESSVNNFAAALLGGTTLTEEGLQKWVIDVRGSLPEQLKSEEDRDPWSITFAKVRPVTLKVTEGGYQITIRGQRYTSGERSFQAMNVTAEYKMEISGPGSKMVRQGDLIIQPPGFVEGQSRLSTQQVTLKTLLQKKFGKLFEPEVKNEGLVLPGKWRNAGRLDLKQLQATKGWLVLAWLESGEPAPPENKVVDRR